MEFRQEILDRILILDGAMGTMIQRSGIISGDNEKLNLTHPEVIRSIHKAYIDAGADIIETNSFGANRISQEEYGMADKAYEMAFQAARLARETADSAPRKVWVAGSIGPTGKSLTLASDASDPSYREYSFTTMAEVFREQIDALTKGGADIILLETCFDALNVKSIIYALGEAHCELPVIISATVSDRSGRTLTGQTLEAFYHSVRHCPGLVAFGINCSLGVEQMSTYAKDIASFSDLPVIFYPNAGIPDRFGRYNDSPQMMAQMMQSLASQGLLNIAGGCCGTSPEHIAAIAGALRACKPRIPDSGGSAMHVSGLETVSIDKSLNFTNIGERTNVAGSRKFARLIANDQMAEALDIARAQIEGGADIIDINMDDPMVDSTDKMRRFLRFAAGEPDIAKAAVMIDSSHWDTIIEGLRNVQGRPIVNSISLKEGKEEFLRKAREIHLHGAAMVVMAFDEQGQAETYERKIEICSRSYFLLVKQAGIPPEDIIFDTNVLTIGTGIAEHAKFGVDFIEAVRWIKGNLPGARTSGGISNLSFAFRGNNPVREAMHSAFLYHAIKAGLDMAIVNPQMLQIYDDIDQELRKAVEDVIFDTDSEATTRLIEAAGRASSAQSEDAGRTMSEQPAEDACERVTKAVIKGDERTLSEDVIQCLNELGTAVAVIEGPLMKGMEQVGELFGDGKMFLPQVVKSARTMKSAVDVLKPYMESGEKGHDRPVFVIATVQGDVHDIGKNITSIILQCSGFEVIDLGVMVPAGQILDKAVEVGADIIGVSGLITPSLNRMEEICEEMVSRGMNTPLFVGGAAANPVHTAVRLASIYPNVHYGTDASATAVMAKKYISSREEFLASEQDAQDRIRALYESGSRAPLESSPLLDGFLTENVFEDIPLREIPAEELMDCFDWRLFHSVCGVKNSEDKFKSEALSLLEAERPAASICCRFLPCRRHAESIISSDGALCLQMLRDGRSLCDFYPSDRDVQMGLFAVRVDCPDSDDLIAHAFRVTLAEAASEYLRRRFQSALPEGFKLIMPGIGYPCCPDHSLKKDVLNALPPMGIRLTDSCAMIPEASICGLVIAHKEAAYLSIRNVSRKDIERYSALRGYSEDKKRLFLNQFICNY